MTLLAGKRAIVTGASRGIGLAIATRMQREGAQVVRMSRSIARVRDDAFTDVSCDVTDEGQVRESIGRLRAEGPPDILVNNAGSFLLKPLPDTTVAEFQQQLGVNLVGPFVLLRELIPAMSERGGHIVTIGSIADHHIFPGNAAYAASKHGLRALHDVMKLEFGNQIRMTLVSPGPTDTTLWDPLNPDARDDLPRRASMLHADDVADAVLYALTRPAHMNVDVLHLSAAAPS